MISIIIPCYNCEKTIKKCLDSVINQTFKNLEIIVINDGSKDTTDNIIKEYLTDSRIKYYSQSNKGIGKTRNFGINKSKGEYIIFLDSDDYLEKDAVQNLYDFALKGDLDLVVSDYYEISNRKKYCKIKEFDVSNIKENPSLILDINLAPWNKMYKKNLIKNNRFEEKLKYEDAPFVIKAILDSKKIGKLNKPTHNYLINENSETTIRDERIFDIFGILNKIYDYISPYDYLKNIYKILSVRIVINYNIQQRYQKKISIANKFINAGFKYIKRVDKNYKKNIYFKQRPWFKRIIEKNKILTKIYCIVYIVLK